MVAGRWAEADSAREGKGKSHFQGALCGLSGVVSESHGDGFGGLARGELEGASGEGVVGGSGGAAAQDGVVHGDGRERGIGERGSEGGRSSGG